MDKIIPISLALGTTAIVKKENFDEDENINFDSNNLKVSEISDPLANSAKMVKKNIRKTKNNICNQCGNKFNDKRELKGHILSVHEGKKLYKCSICNAWKTTLGLMKTHIVFDHDKENLSNCKPIQLLNMNIVHEFEND